jgi:hypothetical protein
MTATKAVTSLHSYCVATLQVEYGIRTSPTVVR